MPFFIFMKRPSALMICFFVTLIIFSRDINAQLNGFKKISWERDKIAPGLVWKSSHTFLNDTIPQNINILIINLNRRKISLSYNPEKNIIVSKQALAAGALATVNAGFFNIKDGGSTTMCISGKPFNGIVNMPCDNKKFDHEGERAVSDIIIIK